MYHTSIAVNFTPTDLDKLQSDLQTHLGNNNTIDSLLFSENTLTILTTSDITNESDGIETFLSSYSYTPTKQSKILSTGTQSIKTSSVTYTSIFAYDYVPKYNYKLKSCIVNCYLTPNTPNDSGIDGFGYKIRVVDIDHNTILGESTLTNHTPETTEVPIDDSFNDNLPSTLELQVRRNDGFGCFIVIRNISFKIEEI